MKEFTNLSSIVAPLYNDCFINKGTISDVVAEYLVVVHIY